MKRSLALVALSLAAATSYAQTYPSRPVTMIVPVSPGGSTDLAARLVSEPLAKALGQPVVVENKPGASGNIGTQQVARSQPDGHVLLVQYSGYHTGNPHLFKALPWDPLKDFSAVANILLTPHVVVVHPSVPVKSLKELAEYAKANPGKVTYCSAGNGSIQHIATEMFAQIYGVKMTHVPYKGSGPCVTDLIAGRIDLFNTTPPSVIGHIKSGKLRGLAFTSTKRHPTMPDIPTSKEAGMPDYLVESWFAIFAPANTPQPVIAKLTGEIRKIVEGAEFRKKAEEQGAFAVYMDPKQLDALVRKEHDHWGKVIRAGNITAD